MVMVPKVWVNLVMGLNMVMETRDWVVNMVNTAKVIIVNIIYMK
jgi:hypothetical protein